MINVYAMKKSPKIMSSSRKSPGAGRIIRNYPDEVIKHALSHTMSGFVRAYWRTQPLDKIDVGRAPDRGSKQRSSYRVF